MRMRNFIRRHSAPIQVTAAVAAAISLGVYIHLLEKSGFTGLGARNAIVLVPIGFSILYEAARRIEGHASRDDTDKSVAHMLEAMVRGYVFPESWSNNLYRAYCHRIDSKGCYLETVAVASPIPGIDERASLPVTGPKAADLVVAEAFNEKKEALKQVGRPPESLDVWMDVRTVVAVPIVDVDDDHPIGTISIDTSLAKSETRFTDKDTASVLINVARAVALLWRSS